MSPKPPRGLSRDLLAERTKLANKALGLDDLDEAEPEDLPPPVQVQQLTTTAVDDDEEEKEQGDEAADITPVDLAAPPAVSPEGKRRAAKTRTGTYAHPYERRDGKRMVKVSFNVPFELYQELRQFETQLPPKQRNAWMAGALQKQMHRDQARWDKAREERVRKAVNKPDED